MTWANNPDQTAYLSLVDDFGAGEDEPVAEMKWTDGSTLYVWKLSGVYSSDEEYSSYSDEEYE
jgi:hypothetical protein